MQRRHRLSRSRDFDAVYRQGKSVSTRSLVLYWFERHDDRDADARVGIAVPRKVGNAVARNRLKRQLREAWRTQLAKTAAGRDYIIVARPGLAEGAEANGAEWLSERVGEALEQAAP